MKRHSSFDWRPLTYDSTTAPAKREQNKDKTTPVKKILPAAAVRHSRGCALLRWPAMMCSRSPMGDENILTRNSDMPDAAVTLNYNNNLDLTFEPLIRAMEGDSIAPATNAGVFSRVDSLNSAKSARHDPVTQGRRTETKHPSGNV